MNHQCLKRCGLVRQILLAALVIVAIAWVFLLPVAQLCAQDGHGHGKQSGFVDFLQEYGLTIQIAGGVVLVIGIAAFIYMRMSKSGKDKDLKPPAPGESQAPK